ncbi:MAG: inositol monophosphatase family protein, partial [Acidimicrobiales bacterium]
MAVVGEEAAAADPRLLDPVGTAERLWVVDPVDGTSNFVRGSPDYAVMVALLERGAAVASWILQPVTGRLFVAEAGSGATVDGRRLTRQPAPATID